MIIGIDIGGTHTDAVLLGDEGISNESKVPTDSCDLFNSIITSFDNITRGINPEKIQRIVFSTTLTTNAIVQNMLSPVGMIILSGPGIDADFYRTNPHFYCVSGYIDHRGREIEPLRLSEIKAVSDKFKAEGIQHIGIVSKFSVRNPEHEFKIKKIIDGQFEKVFLGHEVSGNLNFPRRIATTYLNAAVYPIHKKFFEAVIKSLKIKGLDIPIHILKADGGTMNFDASIEYPGQTILSGPAASTMGALSFASGNDDILSLDIGGTTTDMAVLVQRAPLMEPSGIEIGPYKTLIRSLKTHFIGIGGDSRIKVMNNKLEIGPDRAGVAAAFGGPCPTPTDAMVILGMFSVQDKEKEQAIKSFSPISQPIGCSIEETAERCLHQCCDKIFSEAQHMIDQINMKPVYTIHELREGYQVKPKSLLVMGGPAPYFARYLEKKSTLAVHVLPKSHIANAIGAALARTTCEVVFHADTEQGIVFAPQENFRDKIPRNYSKEQAIEKTLELLRGKAISQGAIINDIETEIVEDLQFNMVRGFYTTGKNIRIKAQVKPGLINSYQAINKINKG